MSAFLSFLTRNLANDTNDTVNTEAKTIVSFSVKYFPIFGKSLQSLQIFFKFGNFAGIYSRGQAYFGNFARTNSRENKFL